MSKNTELFWGYLTMLFAFANANANKMSPGDIILDPDVQNTET